MGKIKDLVSLLRVRQWYKSGVIFIGPIFAGKLFDLFINIPLLFEFLFGFLLISLASAFIYVLNDLIDIEADKHHPEKAKKRPLAAGRISKAGGIFLMLLVGAVAIIGSYLLNLALFAMVILIIVNGLFYNFIFKYHAFLDIIGLSVLYIWRALAGCYITDVYISPWLIVAIFLLALFLVICKRRADLELLGEQNAPNHKKVYDQYSLKMLDNLHIMILTSLFLVYILYAILGPFTNEAPSIIYNFRTFLIISIPVALYLLMRYSFIMLTKPQIARNPERAILDKGIIIGGFFLVVILLVAFYFPIDIFS
ncbi:MAG: UbiA prenyltransferase [Promethearchaeota archaeon CR_4]|nr:MAG: UbiA prenyltransferase [Candidatus Lokiarchaeota archaeon CR_4]